MTNMATQIGKGLGINFLMDYNQERMDRIDTEEAMIYIETMGNYCNMLINNVEN